MDIEVRFLGTSAGVPTAERNVSSILVRRKGESIFFDFGEGTQRQLFNAGLGFGKTIRIFITHIHGDHILGLFPALQTLSLFKRTSRVSIHGPPKLFTLIDYFIEYIENDLPFELEYNSVYDGAVFDYGEYVVRAVRNSHTSWSFSYRFEEKIRSWSFDVYRAVRDGVPKTAWRSLAEGRDVTIDGRLYRAKDYIIEGAVHRRSIVVSGDTMPHEKVVELSRDADVLIHESTFLDELRDRALLTKHTTAIQAAEIAREADVKILVLTHFSARYRDVSPLVSEARKIFPATFSAKDLDSLVIPYVKRSPHVLESGEG